ncbi:unnamed protein product [Dibothriocephalus latus]|uniref:Uncharacterized protein n=1 Tax=Dibothriocephalus latus TaxID=60516 RepID=A0A3P7N6M1_DIBLA|nr:unnamed protein product [Dibothriocephalus latus]
MEQLFSSDGGPAETGIQPHSSRLADLKGRFEWLRLCTHSRLETARKQLKTKLAQEDSFESLQRTVSRLNERLTALEWSLTEQAAYEKVSAPPAKTDAPAFDSIPEALETNLRITLPTKIETLRSRAETHLNVTSRLLRTYQSLKDLVDGLKSSFTERMEQADILLVGSEIARLTSEEWTTSHRRTLEMELEAFADLAAELKDTGPVSTHLEATNSAIESFLVSLQELTGLKTPSSPIQLLIEGQLTNLTAGLQHDRNEVARTMERLRDQLTRGDNSDFETLLISSGVRIETGFGSDCLPFPIQAVHERWSELINRAMNVRGSAESMVDSIQEMTAAFASTVDWLKETKKRLTAIIEIPPQMPFALTGGTEAEAEATADYINTLQPPFLVHIWSGLLETRSFRSSRISVSPLLPSFPHV